MEPAGADSSSARCARREGLILPVVLLVIALLALLGSSFSWLAQADYQASQASAQRLSARLAAESGVQRALVLLRSQPEEFLTWWDNEEELGRQIVWVPGEEDTFTDQGRTVEDLEEGEPAWLYSIVADDPEDDQAYSLRYGLTDEASKLNLNVMSGEMMRRLIEETAPWPEELDLPGLVDAFLDWRDGDDEVRSSGAEKSYYENLRPPYAPSNGRFRTVEELLMVRGFTSEVLYGEDQNRNGILDLNEDDGEATLPDDNADGTLSRGIHPYLTVFSRELDFGPREGQKPDINTASEEALGEAVSPELARYIPAARASGIVFTSVADLLEAPAVPDPKGEGMIENPVRAGDLDRLVDVLTVDGSATPEGEEGAEQDLGLPRAAPDTPGSQPMMEGRVNINTAPAPVLRALGVFTEEEVSAILAARVDLEEEQRAEVSWLTSTGAVSPASFEAAEPYLTARSEQYTIESVGYANHLGVVCRLQVVVELRYGTVPFVRYFRDISALGAGYPVRQLLADRQEREGSFARTRNRT